MGTMSVIMLAQATTAVNVNWPLVIGVSAALLVALLAYLYGTRGGIIARATCKEAVRQPVFAMMMALSMSLLVINTFVPFFSLGEDVKMLKDCGLATILITSLLLAVWTASTSIADEIEGKTAMTLLSKPITRRQFIVGKYLGIVTSILWLMVPTALVFLGLIFFKFFYDAKESSKSGEDVTTALAVAELVQIITGLLLSFMEVSVLSAVSVAISTRLPMALVESSTGGLEPVLFVARLIATVLPALDVFNVAASVASGSIVPANYLGYALIYAMCYCTMGVLLAFILFEDRDLA